MTDTSNIQLTITLIDPNLDEEEKDQEVQKLLANMKQLDEVEEVSRVPDPKPPEGSRVGTGFLAGLLMAEELLSKNAKDTDNIQSQIQELQAQPGLNIN
jgi:hypothetical protein